MRFYPKILYRAASDARVGELEDKFVPHGVGMRALEITQTGQFIGSPLRPCVTCRLIRDDRGSRNDG
jgi:hypothetical protein